MKKIIIVAEHFTLGGAERVLSELIMEWIDKGHEICAVQIRPNMPQASYDLPDNMEYIKLYPRKNRYLRWLQNAKELIKILKNKPDATVIAFVEPAMLIVAISSFFVNNKIVFSERCDPNNHPEKKLIRIARDIIYHMSDVCVFQTEDARNYFPDSIRRKGVIIPNPINPNLPDLYRGERRKAIVFAGRLTAQKNVPMTINAFAKLSKDHPEYVLEIYGCGEMENEIKFYIKELNLTSRVRMFGFVQNLYEKICDCCMYVSSSNYEGISNSMLEALAMGIPTIATDCPVGGARMTISNGENGLLIPVGNAEAMYLAMKKIIEDDAFASKLSKNAYLIREKYPVEKIAARWLEVL